jgi:hypothetical protein
MQLAISDSYRTPQALESLTIDGFMSPRQDVGHGMFASGMHYFNVGFGIVAEHTVRGLPQRREAVPGWIHASFEWQVEKGKVLSFDPERLRRAGVSKQYVY